MKAEHIDTECSDDDVISFLMKTLHQTVYNEAAHCDNDPAPDPSCKCMPGLCAMGDWYDSASMLARVFHKCLDERKINVGSLLLLSCEGMPFTRTFFTGVTLRKPLLQTVIFSDIDEDRVSFKLDDNDLPVVATTCLLFLDLLTASCPTEVSQINIDVEHWFYRPFVTDGMLHVNPEHVLDKFTFNLQTKPSLQPKVAPVKLPFGFKEERKTKKQHKHVQKKGAVKSQQKTNKPVERRGDDTDKNTASDSDSASLSSSGKCSDLNSPVAANAEDDIDPINDVMQEEMKHVPELVMEIEMADQAKEELSADLSQPAASGKVFKEPSFFSKELGLASGSIAPTYRAKCYACKAAIAKGEVRFEWFWNKLKPNGWLHPHCIPSTAEKFELTDITIEKLKQMCNPSPSAPLSCKDERVQFEARHVLHTMSRR